MPVSYPVTIPQPWATSGNKNTIPNTPPVTPGSASWQAGFPPETMQPIQTGGVPPSGKDINGGLNAISQHTVWQQAGGRYKFDAAFAASIGGYSAGMVVQANAGTVMFLSLVDNNTVDPNTTPESLGVQWAYFSGRGFGNFSKNITTTGGQLTLTMNETINDIIVLTGALTSDSIIVFTPSAPSRKNWRVINNTTGAFSVVVKAPIGQSLTMSRGFTNTVFYDGTQLVFPDHDSGLDSPAFRGNPTAPTAAPGTNTTQLATTEFVRTADAALLVNTPLTGVPTAPTAPPNTNTTQIATTAYADNAVASGISNISATYVNANFSAGSTGDLWTDTSAGGFTITLPDPPIGKNLIQFRDIFGSWGVNNLTINPGSKTVLGVAGDFIANVSGRTFGMWYDAANTTWKLI